MQNTVKRLAGPAYLATSAANIYTQNSLIYDIITHIRLVNKTTSPAQATLYVGATGGSAGGTEILKQSIPGLSSIDYYGRLKLIGGTDYLSGVSDTGSAIVITVEGESGVI